uniref:MHC class II beta chain N-terminal domain-containing protein n=1 Tax=Amphilophus citrinellus TaxID=61819 RepID=A0A3Q0RPV1_AMPCI
MGLFAWGTNCVGSAAHFCIFLVLVVQQVLHDPSPPPITCFFLPNKIYITCLRMRKVSKYTLISIFNQNYMMEYNSTRGNWRGFTKFSVDVANGWNVDPYNAVTRAIERKLLCDAGFDILPVLGKTFVFNIVLNQMLNGVLMH